MYDLIVIGGGIAGLYMADKYLQKYPNARICVLEKSDRLGGRIKTIRDNGSIHYEAGAGRINKRHSRVLKLVLSLGLTLVKIGRASNPEVQSKIMSVIEFVKKMPRQEAIKLTFGDACDQVFGKQEKERIRGLFGYNSVFDDMNAYDSIHMFKNSFNKEPYFVIKEGYDAVITRLRDKIYKSSPSQVNIYTDCDVVSISDSSVVTTKNGRVFDGRVVVCAIPRASLLKLFPEEVKKLDAVAPVALNRMYGFVDPTWLSQYNHVTTTPDHIRQFIPVNPDTGLAMVTYSDTHDAMYWNKNHTLTNLNAHLKSVFGRNAPIARRGIHNYFWAAGSHVWRPGISSTEMKKKVMFLKKNVIVVGEAYSGDQGWVEGALSTVDDALNKGMCDRMVRK